MDGKISCDIPFPDGAKGVLHDDQSQLLTAPVLSGPPDAHLKEGVRVIELMPLSLLNADILIAVLVARCLLGFVCSRLLLDLFDGVVMLAADSTYVPCTRSCSWTRSSGQAEVAAGILCMEMSAAGSVSVHPDSFKSAPTVQGESVHPSPLEHPNADMDSCVGTDPMNPLGTLQLPNPLGEALSESTLDASELKEEDKCPSSEFALVSHSPPYELTLFAKVLNNCSSSGIELVSHSSPVVELVKHADHAEEGTSLAAKLSLSVDMVTEQGTYHQSAIDSMPPLSFADMVIRGLKPSDLPSCSVIPCSVIPIPISDEDRYAAPENYPLAPDEICTSDSSHHSPSTIAEQNYLAHVKQLAPIDAYGQLRSLIVEGSHIPAAAMDGLDDYPPSGPPNAFLIGLDHESDIDSEPMPSSISHLATKYGLGSLKHVGVGPVSPIESPAEKGLPDGGFHLLMMLLLTLDAVRGWLAIGCLLCPVSLLMMMLLQGMAVEYTMLHGPEIVFHWKGSGRWCVLVPVGLTLAGPSVLHPTVLMLTLKWRHPLYVLYVLLTSS
ncbi:hypothetical protein Nepgr_013469 [Nepenthes gracilis]|uniref:Uncharacterized protein n=1 Tax=Nepenthes gracilis TaxID=150966 RepID=A0AAD3SHZ0_NEPGR|nr:hypothetical protein Nepgr_013469 [Nepenthes gracilis]